jgi:ubiquinone/menaquinone biosynthesis C-methylase UbiE
VLKKPDEIRGAYSDTATAEEYVDRRFTSAWGSVMHAAQVKTVNDVIQAHRVERVLELAPGPARLSRDVSGFLRGYLCEFNDSMLQVARRRLRDAAARWHLVRGDAFHLPFQDSASLDLVYTFRFIRHFEAADRSALYRQIHGVLKPGGLFIFDAVNDRVGRPARTRDDPANCPVFDEFYTRASLQAELVAHGFTTIALVDVIRHMTLQQRIQVLIGPRSNGLARRLISLLERVPGDPLEWVVVCRKQDGRA